MQASPLGLGQKPSQNRFGRERGRGRMGGVFKAWGSRREPARDDGFERAFGAAALDAKGALAAGTREGFQNFMGAGSVHAPLQKGLISGRAAKGEQQNGRAAVVGSSAARQRAVVALGVQGDARQVASQRLGPSGVGACAEKLRRHGGLVHQILSVSSGRSFATERAKPCSSSARSTEEQSL